MPSVTVLVPSLTKIGPCLSEKCLGTHLSNKMATSRPSWIRFQKNRRAHVSHWTFNPGQMSWSTLSWADAIHYLGAKFNNIGKCISEELSSTCSTSGFFFTTEMAASQPSLIWSRNKITCICKPLFIICVPSLNKIGKCMSEKWWRTCSDTGWHELRTVLFTTSDHVSILQED